MVAAEVVGSTRLQSIRRTPAQERVLAAALDLFAEHGVSGTSLSMIADALGVTKAAIYYQYRTKNEIVLAVAESEFAKLEAAVEAAEAEESPERARERLFTEVIDVAVARRRWVRALQNDPVMVRVLAEHRPLVDIIERIYGLLIGHSGKEATDDDLVRTAILASAIGATVVNPLIAHLDDDRLRRELLLVARRLFDLPVEAEPASRLR